SGQLHDVDAGPGGGDRSTPADRAVGHEPDLAEQCGSGQGLRRHAGTTVGAERYGRVRALAPGARDAPMQQVPGRAMAQVEIFTPTGVVAGILSRPDLVQQPDLRSPVPVEKARWYPLDGSSPEHRGTVLVPPDDVLVVYVPEPDMTLHATWYSIVLEIGPYRVRGKMPTPVGFDPKRALARPGGAFVTFREASVELMNRPDA